MMKAGSEGLAVRDRDSCKTHINALTAADLVAHKVTVKDSNVQESD